MLRTALILVFLVLFFIISIPVYFVLFIIGTFNLNTRDHLSQVVVKFAFRSILWLAGTKMTVIGKELVPKDEAVLFVSNHRSYFDIPVTYVNIKHPVGFVAKKEMDKVPLLRAWMRYIHCIFLDRENIKEALKTILQGVDILKGGHSMYICPEGTRNHTDTLLPFKEGSTKMAEKAGCAIIPIALTHTDDVLENNKGLRIKSAHVTITFGKPVYAKELCKEDKKFLGAYLQKTIAQMLLDQSN